MTSMVLNKNNIVEYIDKIYSSLPNSNFEVENIFELPGGNMSYVYRVLIKNKSGLNSIILKQARNRAKRRDLNHKLPLSRIISEASAIDYIKSSTTLSVLPEIFFIDKVNNILVMSDVSLGKKLLSDELGKNKLFLPLAYKFGKFFGELHSNSFGKNLKFEPVLQNLMLDYHIPIHLTWGARVHFSSKIIDNIIKQSNETRSSFVWLDPVPRNIFVNNKNFALIDFDFSLKFDPAVDLAIFLSSWFIKKIQFSKADLFINKFIKSYNQQWLKQKNSKQNLSDIWRRANNWLGIYLLSRVDGRSGSYIKTKKSENFVRKMGINCLKNKYIFYE